MADRDREPRPWPDVVVDLARRFAPWPTVDDPVRSALDEAIAGDTEPRSIRVRK